MRPKERPIPFNTEMVQAILRKQSPKTQTRRVIKQWPPKIYLPQPVRSELPFSGALAPPGIYLPEANRHGALAVRTSDGQLLGVKPGEFEWMCPYGVHGDRLWVKETWWQTGALEFIGHAMWKAGHVCAESSAGRPEMIVGSGCACQQEWFRWKSPIFMPRWASRILLEVVDVRVERVRDISEEDAIAEACEPAWNGMTMAYDKGFAKLWDSINAKRGFGWEANPWVWVLLFKLLEVRG